MMINLQQFAKRNLWNYSDNKNAFEMFHFPIDWLIEIPLRV